MSRRAKLTQESLGVMREAYEKDCVPIIELASWAGVSRQAVWKFFKRNGVETRKRVATRRVMKCDHCGDDFEVTRARYRDQVLRNGSKKHFCSDNCYFLYLANSDSAVNRHKQRIARGKVSEVFDLEEGHVVHHIDGDHFNTLMSNFMVFENNSDHIKHHHEVRQGEVKTHPIWDGSGGDLKEMGEKDYEPAKSGAETILETDKVVEEANARLMDIRKEKKVKEPEWGGGYAKTHQARKSGK